VRSIGIYAISIEQGDELVAEALLINGYGHFVYNGTNWILLYYRPTLSPSSVTVQKFEASGTYTPTSGTQFAIVECVGGGGGGGGASAGADAVAGGGGGAGGYSLTLLTAAQIGGSQVVTIGAGGIGVANSNGTNGGDTSIGSVCVAKGGSGGGAGSNNTSIGGAGGIAGTGDLACTGAPGEGGHSIGSNTMFYPRGGAGGSTKWGGGGVGLITASAQIGTSGTGFGSGGAGGTSFNSGGVAAGGNGTPGLVFITEYNIAIAGPPGPPGPAGGLTTVLPPQGRLTLQTGTPVMTSTQSAKTTIFYTPYCGNQVPIYDGAAWASTSFVELSALTTDATKSPAAIGVSKVNDWFVWSDAGTLRLSHGPDWTNDTTRAASLTRLNGIWVNTDAITNGPGINRGTYVGTTRSNASSQLDYILGGADVGGVKGWLGVWNTYNRATVTALVQDTTASYGVGVNTIAPHNGSSNNSVQVVAGLAEDFVQARFSVLVVASSAGNALAGIGIDTTTASSGVMVGSGSISGGGYAAGEHTLSRLGAYTIYALAVHQGGTSNATYFGSNQAPGFIGNGLTVVMRN